MEKREEKNASKVKVRQKPEKKPWKSWNWPPRYQKKVVSIFKMQPRHEGCKRNWVLYSVVNFANILQAAFLTFLPFNENIQA